MKEFIAVAETSTEELQGLLNLTVDLMVDGRFLRLFLLAHKREGAR